MKFNSAEARSGEMKVRYMSNRARRGYKETDPITVYEDGGEYAVDIAGEVRMGLTRAECEKTLEGLAGNSERVKMVKAMEFIARQINDEDVFEGWLINGVADGDIEYGDLDDDDEYGTLDYYIDDDAFADLMGCFLRRMARAAKSGGLYCDDVVSKGE